MPVPTRESKTRMSKKIAALVLFVIVGAFALITFRHYSVASSHSKAILKSSFGLIHYETTGIANFIKIKDKEIAIQYAMDSDKVVLNDLEMRMNPELYLSNANGKNIIIHGYLHSEIKWTPDNCGMVAVIHDYLGSKFKWPTYCGGLPTPEPYQEFTLTGWEMKIPFFGEDDYGKKPSRYKLRRSDFE